MAEGFVVERIVEDKFVVGPGGKTERVFLVKWEGYPYGENTWEPRESFIPEAMETIQEYEKSHPRNHTAKSQRSKPNICDENVSESSYDPCDNLCDNPFDNTFDAPQSPYLIKKKKTPKRINNSNHTRLQKTAKKTKKKKKSIRKSEKKPSKIKIPTKNIKKIKKKNKKKRKFESHSESDDEPICNKFNNNKQTFNNSKSVKKQLQNTAKAAPARVTSSVSSMRIPKRKNGEYHTNMSFQERVKLSLQPKTKIVGFNTAKPPQKRNNNIYSNCNAKQTPARKKRKIEKPDRCFYSDSDQSDVPSISPMPNIPDSYQESVQKVESLKHKIQTNIQTNATKQTKIASNTPNSNTPPSADSDLIRNNHNNHNNHNKIASNTPNTTPSDDSDLIRNKNNNRNNIPNTNADSTQRQTTHTMTNHNVFPNKTNEATARHTLPLHNSSPYQSNFPNAFNANSHKQSFLSYGTWNNAKPTSLNINHNNNNHQWSNATMPANANTNDTDNKCISITGIPASMNQYILRSELQRTQFVNIRHSDPLYADPNHRYPHFKRCPKMELSNMADKNKLIQLCQAGQLRVNGQLLSVTSYHKPLSLPCTTKPRINHIQYTNMSGPHDRNINTNHNHIQHTKITNKKVHDLTQDITSQSRSRSRSPTSRHHRPRQRDKDRNREKGDRPQRHRRKQKRNNRNARSSHRQPRDRRPKKSRQHSRSASSQSHSHSDRHKKKDKLKLDQQYHAFVENNNNICNMPALESEKMETDEGPLALPPPPKICSAYLPQTASTAKSKKKNKQNKDNDNDDGHDSSDGISLDMATKISWTDTFRIFGCDDARIIMSAHDIIEVKTDWDDLDNNNHRQPSASASPSLCVSASSKPAEPWSFTLCVDGDGGSGDILPMIQVSVDSTKVGKEYQCPQMVFYQRAGCVSTDYCRYIMDNDMNESQCLFVEKVCVRVEAQCHERSKKQLDAFRKQLENKPVFMSPRLFDKVHIVALKILSVEYSFSGATMNGVIVKILKPYSSNERNLFSFHKEQIPAAVPMGAAMTNTISSQSIQSTETTVTINHRN